MEVGQPAHLDGACAATSRALPCWASQHPEEDQVLRGVRSQQLRREWPVSFCQRDPEARRVPPNPRHFQPAPSALAARDGCRKGLLGLLRPGQRRLQPLSLVGYCALTYIRMRTSDYVTALAYAQ